MTRRARAAAPTKSPDFIACNEIEDEDLGPFNEMLFNKFVIEVNFTEVTGPIGWGGIDRAVASKTSDPRFEPWHWQDFVE